MRENRFFRSDSYPDGRTKQAFKDSCDVNKLVYQAARGDGLSHLEKYGGFYADFTEIGDLQEAHEKLQRGIAIFEALPSEIRREYDQDVRKFFTHVNSVPPEELATIFPALAQEGNQAPQVIRTAPQEPAAPVEPVEPIEPVTAPPAAPSQ